jgi:uncharacterized membrane protein YdjX (TVP38/TMEM64 family)
MLGFGLLALAWFMLPVDAWLKAFGAWAEGRGAAGAAMLAAIYIVGTLVFIPGTPMTIALAVAYGWWALPLVFFCGMTAALIAFLAARFFLRAPIERFVLRHPRLKAFDLATKEHAFTALLLARLSPTPFALQNYVFGVTAAPLPAYLAATALGILPATLLSLWIGLIGRAASGGKANVAAWGFLAFGFVATAALAFWLPREAKKRLGRQADQPDAMRTSQRATISAQR